MSEATTVTAPPSIPGVLEPRTRIDAVRRDIRRARAALHAELRATHRYAGGLLAERQSSLARREDAVKTARLTVRRAYLSRVGRRIDLVALLRQRRADGKPLWTIRDPDGPLSDTTIGAYCADGLRPAQNVRIPCGDMRPAGRMSQELAPAGGIPPLPPVARRAATDLKVRKRALWVGLLYQPDEWLEVRPDPAIVVEWRDRPGEYYALVVWGGDRARIMEFVD